MEQIFDKNPRDNSGLTPLHYAARYGHFKTCKLIIESIEDKNPGNNFGTTPLLKSAAPTLRRQVTLVRCGKSANGMAKAIAKEPCLNLKLFDSF